jgi:diguanylate cyclase (GGDEF)-like protein/PAS domain S-box-containing protein
MATYFHPAPITALLLLLIYYLAGRLGLSVAFVNTSATAVWAPTGIALAAMLVWGYRVWPVILIGAFLVNISTSSSIPASLMIAIGNTLEGLAGAFLVARYANGPHAFDRARDIGKFALLAALSATMVSATIGVTSIALNGLAAWSDFGPIWLTWWLGDATGALIVTPMLVLWARNRAIRWSRRKIAEALLLMLSMGVVSLVVFGDTSPFARQKYPLEFLTLVPILWAGFRFSQREMSVLILLLSGVAIAGTLHGAGPFALNSPNESLLLLQTFVAIVAMTGLILASVIAEKNRTGRILRASEQRYRVVAETATDAIITMTRDGVITYVNPAAVRIFGYSADELIGHDLTMLMPERLRAAHKNSVARYLATRNKHVSWTGLELPGLHRSGREIAIEVSFGEYRQGPAHVFIGVMRDISERKRAEQSERWLAAIVESSDEAIVGRTLDGVVLSWNRGAEQIYGYAAAEMIGQPVSVLVPPENMEELSTILALARRKEHIRNHETVRIRKDGTRIHVSLTISPIVDASGEIQGISTISRDISERRQSDQRIRHLAQHDALTGLPNRMLCHDRIEQAILHARRNQATVAVLFLDLDGFKQINDTLGHQVGDEVLRTVAKRLQRCLREEDTIARIGGDEFVICLPAIDNTSGSVADKLLESLRAPLTIEHNELHVTGSIGISMFPHDGADIQTLLRVADTAMYRAKGMGRNRYHTRSTAAGVLDIGGGETKRDDLRG